MAPSPAREGAGVVECEHVNVQDVRNGASERGGEGEGEAGRGKLKVDMSFSLRMRERVLAWMSEEGWLSKLLTNEMVNSVEAANGVARSAYTQAHISAMCADAREGLTRILGVHADERTRARICVRECAAQLRRLLRRPAQKIPLQLLYVQLRMLWKSVKRACKNTSALYTLYFNALRSVKCALVLQLAAKVPCATRRGAVLVAFVKAVHYFRVKMVHDDENHRADDDGSRLRTSEEKQEERAFPVEFEELYDDICKVHAGNDVQQAILMSDLVRLRNTHGVEKALQNTTQLLNSIPKGTEWFVQMESLEQDLKEQKLLRLDTILQKGKELVEKGRWVPSDASIAKTRPGAPSPSAANVNENSNTISKKKVHVADAQVPHQRASAVANGTPSSAHADGQRKERSGYATPSTTNVAQPDSNKRSIETPNTRPPSTPSLSSLPLPPHANATATEPASKGKLAPTEEKVRGKRKSLLDKRRAKMPAQESNGMPSSEEEHEELSREDRRGSQNRKRIQQEHGKEEEEEMEEEEEKDPFHEGFHASTSAKRRVPQHLLHHQNHHHNAPSPHVSQRRSRLRKPSTRRALEFEFADDRLAEVHYVRNRDRSRKSARARLSDAAEDVLRKDESAEEKEKPRNEQEEGQAEAVELDVRIRRKRRRSGNDPDVHDKDEQLYRKRVLEQEERERPPDVKEEREQELRSRKSARYRKDHAYRQRNNSPRSRSRSASASGSGLPSRSGSGSASRTASAIESEAESLNEAQRYMLKLYTNNSNDRSRTRANVESSAFSDPDEDFNRTAATGWEYTDSEIESGLYRALKRRRRKRSLREGRILDVLGEDYALERIDRALMVRRNRKIGSTVATAAGTGMEGERRRAKESRSRRNSGSVRTVAR